VLEFAGTAAFQVTRDRSGLSVALPGVAPGSGLSASQALESGDTLSVTPLPGGSAPGGLTARLDTLGGHSDVFTLQNPYRIVIDTTTNLDPSVPPPPDYDHLPVGVAHRQLGKLHLLSFDSARYQARVVSAPYGSSGGVADFVSRAGGVAGVNGGYFDPASALPVDLVAQGGLMLFPSLERRATLGLDEGGRAQLGYPRPRYVLSGEWGSATVNTVTARPNPAQLTAFVGDGHTPVGGSGLLTLVLAGGQVARVAAGQSVPAPAELSVTFDPARFPGLPRTVGNPLTLTLDWRASGWDTTFDALAAGPLLVQGGQYALNPAREGFNTAGSIWRPTRQVAFALVGGQPSIAYLENGTPEEFARALIAAGVQDAMRLDSGSSATVFVAGGYTGTGGYLNTVYSRTVPNAIVFVPRAQLGVRK
jgi:Phosphodiester glycosidase